MSVTSPPEILRVSPAAGDLISAAPFEVPDGIDAQALLLTHYMPSVGGDMTPATTLLFVPQAPAPAGGWPVVAWAHGTTTGGQKLRAPSLSATLDGDLTAGGYVTRYVWVIGSLVAAGYAVVAPDLEGLGAAASVPAPYFVASSLARSLLSGVRAAHHASTQLSTTQLSSTQLSTRWAAMGHSEGGHGALSVESHLNEAADLSYAGTVAFAPLNSVAGIVDFHGARASSDPDSAVDSVVQQNFNVGLLATGLHVEQPQFELSTIMGSDLEQLLPSFTTKGSVDIVADITEAVRAKTVGAFSGFDPNWAHVPVMSAFLAANDPAETPGFTLEHPTLILQGGRDVSVPEPMTAAFTEKLIAARAPVIYRSYPEADHFTVVPEAMPAALDFLARHLSKAT